MHNKAFMHLHALKWNEAVGAGGPQPGAGSSAGPTIEVR